MSDGSRLRQSWYSALNDSETRFRQLLASPAVEWKRLSNSVDGASAKQKGKAKVLSLPELSDVVVHRNSTKGGDDVYRMVLDVPTGDEQVSLEPWKAVLTTPELRQEWDPAVEDAHLVEVFDLITRISKTNYTLGWPANPRDSVTISRAFHDTTTLIDITTSLPRSPDEPAYLRPSPPFVRSHVNLFAWCIQYTQPQPSSPNDPKKPASGGRIRITCFWQHDLKALWGFGSSMTALTQQLSTMTLSLFKTVMKRGSRVPKLTGYGNGVSVERVRYQIDREALTLDYAIIPDDEEHSIHHELGLQGMDEVHTLREHRRLTRSIECVLPSLEGWDVQVAMKGSSDEVESIPWSAHAMRSRSSSSTFSPPDQILLRITHGALTDDDAVLKVKIVIEVSGGTRGLRLNGLAVTIHELEERDPSSRFIPQKMLQDVASAVDLSIQTSSSVGTTGSVASSTSGQPLIRPHTERTPAAEKSILSKVRRNYIYFSSLLQEPEAKWRRTIEARGVSITQLDSIDPTLVVYRAEATFVGVNLWDLYGAVLTPGARIYWDKQHEDGVLLEDVNELTELWHVKTKPAWPVNGRDAVVLKTVYKSPTTIHVFSFSVDDPHIFHNIPPVEPNVIRTQVDLQGWAIEALSPTTTLLTLLEQSDPKGWTNKTSIPTQMINTLAGIGEFAIKCGGPPVVTRLSGAKANELRYDHERGSFKIDYEPSVSRRPASTLEGQDDGSFPTIECEIRCDIDTWGASLDIVVDPPPQTITCLRRHRLSAEGGGLWLTLTHDSVFVDDERLLALVRRAPGKEKGLVMVNGAKVVVDVEELAEHEIKSLTKQKRVKPPRIPLDQPPVMSVIRRRKAEWSGAEGDASSDTTSTKGDSNGNGSVWASAPRISSPLSRLFSYAVDQATTTTQQAVAAISPANYSGGSTLDPTKLPMQYALEALAWTQEFTNRTQSPDGWAAVSDKGMVIQRKLLPEISPVIPVHKGFKVIEGVSAEELASVITEFDCRKTWDERYDSVQVLESYGGQARTTFHVAKGGFPFRDRGFYLANVMARAHHPPPSLSRRNTGDMAEQSNTARNAIFCVSASFSPESTTKVFSAAKFNPYTLPIGRVYIDAWILETLDPYTKENYAIPSSRCTRLVAMDYAGSVPATFNSTINATLARGVLAVEAYMKSVVKAALPITRLPAPGLVISDKRPEEHHGAASSANSGSGGDLGGGGEGVVGPMAAPFMAWKLRKRDENRVLVEARFDVDKKLYKSSVIIRLPARSSVTREASNTPTATGERDKGDTSPPSTAPSTTVTPRPSRLILSPSPHGRQRQPSDQSLPEMAHSPGNDATLMLNNSSSSSLSQAQALTPMLPMPGSMMMTPGLPPTTNFPTASSAISGLPAVSPTLASLSTSPSTAIRNTSSVSISPPPRLRQRAASSGAGALHRSPFQSQLSQPEGTIMRGRTTSSAFTMKGEVKPATDLLVMEVVIDSKMFRVSGKGMQAGYVVDVRARRRKDVHSVMKVSMEKANAVPLEGPEDVVRALKANAVVLSSPVPTSSTSQLSLSTPTSNLSSASGSSDTPELPFVYTLNIMPPSPSHSSGLSSEVPSRHLLRMTLPTSQYRVSSVWDPLVGAMRGAPAKPEWMKVLEEEENEGGWIIDVLVGPLIRDGGEDKANAEKGKQCVLINGKEVPIVGEKESLTTLGREELLDDRVGRMGILSRFPNESKPLPDDLMTPIAIANELLFPPSAYTTNIGSHTQERVETGGDDRERNIEGENGKDKDEDSQSLAKTEEAITGLSTGLTVTGGPGGFLGFLQGYPNPLTRFGFMGAVSSMGATSVPGEPDATGILPKVDKGKELPSKSPISGSDPVTASSSEIAAAAVTAGIEMVSVADRTRQQHYQISVLVFVALIAFLCGSLLRSLLSPADFIYVVTDISEAEEASGAGVRGWREIRRLLEIKYLIGGWDFQVAVVRRH